MLLSGLRTALVGERGQKKLRRRRRHLFFLYHRLKIVSPMRKVAVKCRTREDYEAFLGAFAASTAIVREQPSAVKVYTPAVEKTRRALEPYFVEWTGMPEFVNGYSKPKITVTLHLNDAQYDQLCALTRVTTRLQHHSAWFPQRTGPFYQYVHDADASATLPLPRYPVYIVSLGRAESRYTSKRLDEAGVPYYLVVEPSEYEAYCSHTDKRRVLRLPRDYSRDNTGSVPARNFAWAHSVGVLSTKRHWVLDDNIEYFMRLNRNRRNKVLHVGASFAAAEDFVDRYENIGIAGFHGTQCVKGDRPTKPYLLNSRVYSCMLINNALPMRWRGRYNEDTDLSLRVLKHGMCTLLFNCFLFSKHTMRMKGGNTDGIYANGRREFAESLAQQHPDVAKVVHRFGRWHHMVDYRPFAGISLRRKRKAPACAEPVNNYFMRLVVRA